MSSTDFYRAFEDRYRGSRELIRTRLQAYLPFIAPLPGVYKPARAIDLGCGRGEWLELLQGAGFAPQGVDLDAGMLAACTERGLPVTQGDALAHLRSLGDASQCIVSGFHIAEHLPFDDLTTLVQQAFRVLKPGGLLILETPNPENVVVGTSSFYLDPTHLRPIPPLLLSFLPEHYGFARVHIVRLQQPPELHERTDIGLMDVLSGVSLDYAVVAQKDASPDVMARFDAAFGAHYGINLNELASRYEDTQQRRLSSLQQRLALMEAQASGMTDALGRIGTLQDRLLEASTQLVREQSALQQLQIHAARTAQDMETARVHARATESRAQEHMQRAVAAEALAREHEQRAVAAEALAREHEQRAVAAEALAREHEQRAVAAEALARAQQKRIEELDGNSHHWWRQACSLEMERNSLRQSASWRITAPLRWVGGLILRGDIMHSAATIQNPSMINWVTIPVMRVILNKPVLAEKINRYLLRFPKLHSKLVNIARSESLMPGEQKYATLAGSVMPVAPEPIALDNQPKSSTIAGVVLNDYPSNSEVTSANCEIAINDQIKAALRDVMSK